MIIGPDFIWLHVPKCAGTAVERALRGTFRGRKDIHFDRVTGKHPAIWHHNIPQRLKHDADFDPSGKRILAGIRRLPKWLLSRVHYEVARSPDQVPTREMLAKGAFFTRTGSVLQADSVLRRFNTPPVDRWIRDDHLEQDLCEALRINEIKVPRVNETSLKYIKDISFWFTPAELKSLYEANPEWAEIEKRLYGSLLEE
ncbi:hypothetical protein [Aliiroseovarius sediminis]|uniref:hypothetical protein n=1 Tax=Aliiroseovarius sediminis TaxID=2925839 RepID=UPI001F59DE13|nr:hypothetical protein [Aliiroseovarius sediminis]MCI2395569.1 hypothetical protein [Aliiroseovarius sediminis]